MQSMLTPLKFCFFPQQVQRWLHLALGHLGLFPSLYVSLEYGVCVSIFSPPTTARGGRGEGKGGW